MADNNLFKGGFKAPEKVYPRKDSEKDFEDSNLKEEMIWPEDADEDEVEEYLKGE